MEYEGNQETGAATATAVDEVGGTSTEVDTTGNDTMSSEGGDGFIVTESYVVPPATPKKHRGTITGVTLLTTKTGSTGITVAAHSDDNGRDYEQIIWPPAAWVNNPRITKAQLDILPRPEGFTSSGRPKQTPAERFGSSISNSKGSGDVQRLLQVAKTAGRTAGAAAYTDVTGFVDQLNTLLAGTPVIFTTKEEKNDDPQYQARERVNGFYGYDFDPAKLKNYEAANGSN